MLHVQEVGGQGTLGGIGVVSSLLALLLLLNRLLQLRGDTRHDELSCRVLKGAQQVSPAIGSGLAEEQVRLANIVGSEGLDQLNDGVEAANSLCIAC